MTNKKAVEKSDTHNLLEGVQLIESGIQKLCEAFKEPKLGGAGIGNTYLLASSEGKENYRYLSLVTRPEELLQSLLDLIRADFEQIPITETQRTGSLLKRLKEINSIQSCLPGYISITSQDFDEFEHFWSEQVIAYILRQYPDNRFKYMLVMISAGSLRYNASFLKDVANCLDLVTNWAYIPLVAHDESLENKVRVSIWLI